MNHKQENTYDKIFVAALVNNPHVRTHVEEEMRKNISMHGLQVESSLDYFPPKFTQNRPPEVQSMHFHIQDVMKWTTFFTIGLPLLVGSMFLSIPAALVAYFLTLPIFCRREQRRQT